MMDGAGPEATRGRNRLLGNSSQKEALRKRRILVEDTLRDIWVKELTTPTYSSVMWPFDLHAMVTCSLCEADIVE
jgi:hypothetical protein